MTSFCELDLGHPQIINVLVEFLVFECYVTLPSIKAACTVPKGEQFYGRGKYRKS